MAHKFTDKNLRYFRDIGFSAEEMVRVFRDVPPSDIAKRLTRLNRQDGRVPPPSEANEPARRVALSRPFPPDALTHEDRNPFSFVAAPDVRDWLIKTFLADRGPLRNPDHDHLFDAEIGVIWTNVPNQRGGKSIAATAEIPQFQGNPWAKALAELHLAELLGGSVPDFLLTFDTVYAAEADDATWCARCEHELYHCGQAMDRWGSPRFNPFTGLPVFCVRPHDCEEFEGVVRRYGGRAAAAGTQALINAGSRPPLMTGENIAMACGTCGH